jgi:hypothetical protein
MKQAMINIDLMLSCSTVGAGACGGDGDWAGHIGGGGGTMGKSRGCPVKGPVVGSARVAEVVWARGEGGSGVSCRDILAAPRTRRGAIARERRRARWMADWGRVVFTGGGL